MGTAAGCDNITAEMLKCVEEEELYQLTYQVNQKLKV